jgi:hypothetical protein
MLLYGILLASAAAALADTIEKFIDIRLARRDLYKIIKKFKSKFKIPLSDCEWMISELIPIHLLRNIVKEELFRTDEGIEYEGTLVHPSCTGCCLLRLVNEWVFKKLHPHSRMHETLYEYDYGHIEETWLFGAWASCHIQWDKECVDKIIERSRCIVNTCLDEGLKTKFVEWRCQIAT